MCISLIPVVKRLDCKTGETRCESHSASRAGLPSLLPVIIVTSIRQDHEYQYCLNIEVGALHIDNYHSNHIMGIDLSLS